MTFVFFFFSSPYSRGVPFSLKVQLQWYYYNHLNQAMPLVILTEDQQVTYTLYMYSSISFVPDVVEHQHFVFSATKFCLYIDLKSSIYNIEVDLGIASLLDTVIRLNHLWNLHLHLKFCSFCFQNSFFPPRKWMNSISNWLSTALIKCLNWSSPVFERFQNRCN